MPRDQAKIPNVRNWAVRDLMEVLSRYGIRASAALNSEVCNHHPEMIEEGGRLGWEWIFHNETNALRLTEMDPAEERAAIRATIDRIEAASGTRPGRMARPVWRRPGTRSTISRRPASAMSATGSMTTSPTCSRLGRRRWCHCRIRCRPTTSRPISR